MISQTKAHLTSWKLDTLPACPSCLNKIDGASDSTNGNEDRGPAPGDVSVCLHCCAFLEFGPGLASVSLVELESLDPETQRELKRARAIVERISPRIRKRKR